MERALRSDAARSERPVEGGAWAAGVPFGEQPTAARLQRRRIQRVHLARVPAVVVMEVELVVTLLAVVAMGGIAHSMACAARRAQQ